MAAVAACGHEFLVTFIGDLGEIGIGALELTLLGAFCGCLRRLA